MHDGFFRVAMSDLSVAKDLLKAHLPQKLVQQIDWDTLQITNKSYVDQQLRHFLSDMVYKCLLQGREAYIFLLIEHQSTPDPLMPFRVLKYDVMICDEHIRQGHKELPLIANLVLYSGKKSPYPYSLDIYDCFQEADMAREMMFKPLQLVDLGQESEAELATHGKADMLELLLKQSQQETFVDWVEKATELLQTLFDRDYWESGLRYMFDRERQVEGEELAKKLELITPSKKEEIMHTVQTIGEKRELIGEKRGIQLGEKRGEKRGVKLGKQETQREMTERMLLKGMEIFLIEDLTGLPTKEIMTISDRLKRSKN